jgi:hypothetical protein
MSDNNPRGATVRLPYQVEAEGSDVNFRVALELDVKPIVVEHAFIGAFEGGYSSWIHSAKRVSGEYDPDAELVWYGQDAFWQNPFKFTMTFDREEDAEGEGKGKITITRSQVREGLAICARDYPHVFHKHMNEEGDALDDDALVQCIVFGKVVYG